MKVSLFLISFFVLFFLACLPVHSEVLSLTGDWNYQDTKSATDEFTENYSVSTGKTFYLTDAMSLGADLRFNRKKSENITSENTSSSVTYLINNDLFALNLSGSASEEFNSKNAENSSRSIAANWISNWEVNQWIPQVGLNYNQSWLEDDQSLHLVESEAMSSGGDLRWNFWDSNLFYSFNMSESRNLVTEGKAENANHFARFQTMKTFWDDKLSVGFSQQYTETENQNTLQVVEGIALLPVTVSAFADEVALPAGNYALTVNSDLTDGDKTDSAVTTVDDAPLLHIGFQTSFQTVNTLYVYTDLTLTGATPDAFSWDLYSSGGNATWSLESSHLTSSYDSSNNRFEIDISGYSRNYLGVVASSDAGVIPVTFSEIEVFQKVLANGNTTLVENRLTNQNSSLDLNLKVTPAVQLTSNLSYQQNSNSIALESTSTKVSAAINWSPVDTVNLRLDGSVTTQKHDNSFDSQTRIFGASIVFPLLPTVMTSWGATYLESYENMQKLSENYNYNFQATAQLYKDLEGRVNASFMQSEDTVDDTVSNSTSANTTLTARLVPGLVASLSANYNKSSGGASTEDGTFSFNWRLSDIVSATANYNQAWADIDTSSMSFGLNVALTRNMQVSLTYGQTIRPESGHISTMSWKWTINQFISMFTSGVYENGNGVESWSVLSKINTRFTVM